MVERVEDLLDQPRNDKHLFGPTEARYPEPHAICDATSDFEEMDRGDGWGIDDEKTYHRTEK